MPYRVHVTAVSENFIRLFRSHFDPQKTTKLGSRVSLSDTATASTACESFLEFYPVDFPDFDITRKMFVLSMILPIFIRKEGKIISKVLSAEQQGEELHKEMNELERVYSATPNKSQRYFQMKKAYVQCK